MNNLNRDIIIELMSLKNKLRTGWLLPGRNIPTEKVESVADHTWAACMIAELFLPESSDEMVELVYCKINK